ncbi:MAG TPA: serine/threonine-protein phosphatase [Phycisphaerales bacterium]|nr:serine/threonine-protein phosphatase [Phycisphaerales bacterium]
MFTQPHKYKPLQKALESLHGQNGSAQGTLKILEQSSNRSLGCQDVYILVRDGEVLRGTIDEEIEEFPLSAFDFEGPRFLDQDAEAPDALEGTVNKNLLIIPLRSPRGDLLGAFLSADLPGPLDQQRLELAQSLAHVACISLREVEQAKRQAELRGQMREVWEVSNSLLPKPDRCWKNYDCCSLLIPSQTAAGDCLDYFQVDSDHLAFFVADAAGKGAGPCLQVSTCRAYFRALIAAGHSLGFAVTQVNELLYRDLGESRFITAWFGYLNERTHQLLYVNAGHSLAFKLNGEIDYFQGEVSLPLGLFQDTTYEAEIVSLADTRGLAIFTDGWTERKTADGDMYGARRLMKALRDAGKNSRETLEKVFQRFEVDCHPTPKDDDISALVLQKLSPNAS